MGSSFAQRLSYPKCLKILKARGSKSAQMYDTCRSTLFNVTISFHSVHNSKTFSPSQAFARAPAFYVG